MKNKIKLKKGDEVIVLAGKDKGKRGKIVRVIPDLRKVVVSDINKYKKHQKMISRDPFWVPKWSRMNVGNPENLKNCGKAFIHIFFATNP